VGWWGRKRGGASDTGWSATVAGGGRRFGVLSHFDGEGDRARPRWAEIRPLRDRCGLNVAGVLPDGVDVVPAAVRDCDSRIVLSTRSAWLRRGCCHLCTPVYSPRTQAPQSHCDVRQHPAPRSGGHLAAIIAPSSHWGAFARIARTNKTSLFRPVASAHLPSGNTRADPPSPEPR
jgi:hypothetical protein